MFQVVFDEIKTKVISARICKIDATGSLYVIERERETEREGATYKKTNVESDDVFELFREYKKSKVNLNFNHVTQYVKKVFHFDNI